MSRPSTTPSSITRAKESSVSSKADGTNIKRILDDHGQLVEEAHYVNGLLQGKRILWSPAGIKIGEADYQDGKLHGRSVLWNETGNKILDACYESGELHGPYSSWWDNGIVKEQGCFKNGKRVGVYRWFTQGGKLLSEQSYPTDSGTDHD